MTETADAVGAVILAAGSSSRLGRPKQIVRFEGESLLRRAVAAAENGGCRPVVVVTGAHAEASRRELEGLDVIETYNGDWQSGMGSSIRAGVASAVTAEPRLAAVVLMVCDQPHVTANVVARIVAVHRSRKFPLVASAYGGSFGVPALFSSTFFSELAAVEGAAGAKQVIQRHEAEGHFLPFAGAEVDVDTEEDVALLRVVERAADSR